MKKNADAELDTDTQKAMFDSMAKEKTTEGEVEEEMSEAEIEAQNEFVDKQTKKL